MRLLAVAGGCGPADAQRMNAAGIARSILDGSRVDAELAGLSERERVLCWRFALLGRAGFSEEESAALALRNDVDLHEAAELLVSGCPPGTALQILL